MSAFDPEAKVQQSFLAVSNSATVAVCPRTTDGPDWGRNQPHRIIKNRAIQWDNDPMADFCTTEKRSEIMSRIHSKDTTPELLIRRLVYRMGYRYRLHVKRLPGKPDIAMIGRRKIIDVRGCFWHGHNDCKYGRIPKSNAEYWVTKIGRNKARDAENLRRLETEGWQVLIVWECELENLKLLERRLRQFIEAR
ncbi:MAG: very short patch repair endonuclease [Rhodocyclaceae bacterium]|nr:very short patch repair endonuclease [Rhodocyclaceae bacterium]